LRHWTTALKQSKFSEKLVAAKQRIQASEPEYPDPPSAVKGETTD